MVLRRGRRVENPLFRATFKENDLGWPRFAFIVSRAVAKRAVKRNLLRRRAREWVRKQLVFFKKSVDVAVFLKKEATEASRKKFYEELERLTAGIMR